MRHKKSAILPVVLTAANALVAFSHHNVHQAFREFEKLQKISDTQLRRSIYHAIGKKYIVIKRGNGTSRIEVTERGRKLLGMEAIKSLTLQRNKVWDGKWRVVLFDIPEEHKKKRDGFSKNLKNIGFIQIQKSVFAFPFPCADEVSVLADFHGVQPYINFLVADSIAPSKKMEKHFEIHKPK